ATAQNMNPADRQAMIERMVQGLAARLDQQGDDLPGWLKLVRAYSVLDRKDDAQKALARAKSQFSGNMQAIEQLDALAAELGLKSRRASSEEAFSSAPVFWCSGSPLASCSTPCGIRLSSSIRRAR